MKNTGNGRSCNREEAVKEVGIENVNAVERENCEWLQGGGQAMGENDTVQTWTARHVCAEGLEIVAVYYVSDAEFVDNHGNQIEDLSNINWKIDHYEIQ